MPSLNAKQQRFVEEYIIDLNAAQAAIRAGYSAKTARQIGSRLLTQVDVKAAVAAHRAKAAEVAEFTLASHLETLNDLRNQAIAAGQFAAATTAEVHRGKASGFYIDRTEHRFAEMPKEQRLNRLASILNTAKQRVPATNGTNGKRGNGTHE